MRIAAEQRRDPLEREELAVEVLRDEVRVYVRVVAEKEL